MAFSEEVIERLISTYPKLCGINPTSYTLYNRKYGVYGNHHLEICHASMRYLQPLVWDELITAIPKKSDYELEYILALIAGPFQKWREYIELCVHGDNYYLYIKDLNLIPSRVVYNLCIASRAPIEQAGIVQRWNDLIQSGVHPSVALCVSARDLEHNKMMNLHTPYDGHWWFQADHDWSRIILGNPQIPDDCPSFSENPNSSTPTNTIWGKGDLAEVKGYLKLDINELDEKLRKELNL